MAVFGSMMLALGALAQQGSSAHALTNCDTGTASIDGEEQAFLGLINQYRASNGLGSLALSSSLSRASAWMSNDLGVNAYFAHTDSLGRTPYSRVQDCGYPTGAGENIAGGTAWSTAQAVFDGWKASPGHNANMLTSYYVVIGIGRVNVPGSPYGWYWTTDFGSVNDSGAPPPTNTPANTPTTTATPVATTPATSTPTSAPPTATATGAPQTSTPTPTTGSGASTSTPTPSAATSTPTGTPPSGGTATPTRTPTSVPESGSATKTPTPGPEAAAVVSLASGANLIAWASTDRAPAQAFGGAGNTIAIVYAWDPATSTWRRYGPGLPAFLNNLTMLHKGDAYWIIAKATGSVTVGQ